MLASTLQRQRPLVVLLCLVAFLTTSSQMFVASAADVPPSGLFAKLDTDQDAMLSVEEFNNGWPSMVQEIGSGGGASSSTFSWSNWLPANTKGGFWKGFTSGVAMILATEIGDKTFFIAAVLSMRQERSAVFLGTVISSYVMTVLSSIMGLILPSFIPVKYTHILGGILFLYFGIKLLLDSRTMEANRVSEELEEVEEELMHPKKRGDEESQQNQKADSSGKGRPSYSVRFVQGALQAFTLTFLGEWGDRSQVATFTLSAAKNPYGVIIGGCIGHTMSTGLAVLGGRILAGRISERSVSCGGGIIFVVFGLHSVFFETQV